MCGFIETPSTVDGQIFIWNPFFYAMCILFDAIYAVGNIQSVE